MSVTIDLPATPYVGLTFRPDSTDSIGTVLKVHGPQVTYSYAHAPEQKHTRRWVEIRNLAWAN